MANTSDRIFVIFFLIALLGCTAQRPVATQLPPITVAAGAAEDENGLEKHLAQKALLFSNDYVATPDKPFDLIHTRLEGSFDWANSQFPATATLTLTPHVYDQDAIILDAKGMVIHAVDYNRQAILDFTYDQRYLTIPLPTTVRRTDTFQLTIAYVARPEVWAKLDSLNPSPDKGIYFIDPLDTLPNRPRQVWTQGQAEGASTWFPTIDHPNQRMTQDIIITVADSLTTFSNGLLVSSTKQENGMRTDHWQLDKPHPPYLAALAAGTFDVVADTAGNIPLAYYMEPPYSPHAKAIFGTTVPMMDIFQKRLGVAYPWYRYAQIAVRDFTAGGMENTGATIMYDAMNVDSRSLLDRDFEGLIAHELFHQWFGDLVTCESWQQLTLNEGLASYGEYLWWEHKYGPDGVMHEVESDRARYLNEAEQEAAPVVRYFEGNSGNMFNRHTYQKGAMIMRALQHLLGDAVFFEGLQHYLTTHAYQSVELHDMRQAFEAVSGKDLLWFFDQWFLTPGHPELTITITPQGEQTTLTIQQQHSLGLPTPYRLLLPVTAGDKHFGLWLTTADTTLLLDALSHRVHVDGAQTSPATYTYNRDAGDWSRLLQTGTYFERQQAITYFSDSAHFDSQQLLAALNDPFWALRQQAVDAVSGDGLDESWKAALLQVAQQDPEAKVRSASYYRLLNWSDTALAAYYENALADSAYSVVGQGLIGLMQYNRQLAVDRAAAFERAPSESLMLAIAYVYAYGPSQYKWHFFRDRGDQVSRWSKPEWYDLTGTYLANHGSTTELMLGIDYLEKETLQTRRGQIAWFAYQALKQVHESWQTELSDLRTNEIENDRRQELERLDSYANATLERISTESRHASIRDAGKN